MVVKLYTELNPESRGFSPLRKQKGFGIPFPSENHQAGLEPNNSSMRVDKGSIPDNPIIRTIGSNSRSSKKEKVTGGPGQGQ